MRDDDDDDESDDDDDETDDDDDDNFDMSQYQDLCNRSLSERLARLSFAEANMCG